MVGTTRGMNRPSPLIPSQIQRPPLAGGLGPTAEANRGGYKCKSNTTCTIRVKHINQEKVARHLQIANISAIHYKN